MSNTGRQNKNRGRKFERDVADALKWTRVPYSGAMKDWGKADVVDGFYKKRGLWAAECKTHVVDGDEPANLHIKHKWVAQMMGGEEGGRRGVLIVRRVRRKGQPGKKGPQPFVIMLDDTYEWFIDKIRRGKRRSLDNAWDPEPVECTCYTTPMRGKGHNFVIQEEWLEHASGGLPLKIQVQAKREHVAFWYVFSLEDFATYVHAYDIMEYDDASEDR